MKSQKKNPKNVPCLLFHGTDSNPEFLCLTIIHLNFGLWFLDKCCILQVIRDHEHVFLMFYLKPC
jgi:hypothetical protein